MKTIKIRKKGNKFEINYRLPGCDQPFSERFPTMEEAELRIAQINVDKMRNDIHPPKPIRLAKEEKKARLVTVRTLMEEFVKHYGLNHWGDSYLSMNLHRIEHYILPYLGDAYICDLTPHDLDVFYDSLQTKPAVSMKGKEDKKAKISPSVIAKIHDLLRSALNQAIAWGYIQTNPAEHAKPPKYRMKKRDVWTPEEARRAIGLCNDPVLRLALLLALGCSMRIGEILALRWEDLHISDEEIEKGAAWLMVDKELRRCEKDSLERLRTHSRDNVMFVFPEYKKTGCSTALVLKTPKTESSVRKIYTSKTVAQALRDTQESQKQDKAVLGEEYEDFGLVFAHNDGRPYEPGQINRKLKELCKETGLPEVVFHSLRHCSTSIKLQLSGGDIKTVQGDTGHSQARMVTDVYAHSFAENRRVLSDKMEESFFKPKPEAEPDDESEALIQKIRENPELFQLLIAAFGKK